MSSGPHINCLSDGVMCLLFLSILYICKENVQIIEL